MLLYRSISLPCFLQTFLWNSLLGGINWCSYQKIFHHQTNLGNPFFFKNSRSLLEFHKFSSTLRILKIRIKKLLNFHFPNLFEWREVLCVWCGERKREGRLLLTYYGIGLFETNLGNAGLKSSVLRKTFFQINISSVQSLSRVWLLRSA